MSSRPFLVTIVLVAAASSVGHLQTPGRSAAALAPETRWHRAIDAWEAGRYPAALEDLRGPMASPAAPEYFERVALLTGELYVTTVLTTDGRNPKISATGGFASYETGPAEAAVTR